MHKILRIGVVGVGVGVGALLLNGCVSTEKSGCCRVGHTPRSACHCCPVHSPAAITPDEIEGAGAETVHDPMIDPPVPLLEESSAIGESAHMRLTDEGVIDLSSSRTAPVTGAFRGSNDEGGDLLDLTPPPGRAVLHVSPHAPRLNDLR